MNIEVVVLPVGHAPSCVVAGKRHLYKINDTHHFYEWWSLNRLSYRDQIVNRDVARIGTSLPAQIVVESIEIEIATGCSTSWKLHFD